MRIDLIFSNWLLLWYIFYISGIITSINPQFALICALIVNLFVLCLMLYYKTNMKIILYFVIVMMVIKIIPLLTLTDSPSPTATDVVFTIVLLGLYLGWLFLNNTSIKEFINDTSSMIFENKINFPGMKLLSNLM